MDNAPVAVFDSGLGGISVLRELAKELPHEDFLYFGDSANAPYGPKTLREVRTLTLAAAENLFGRGCKALVIACNTATSAAAALLRETWPSRPIIGIEPALKPAAVHKRVLVLATEMTLREEKFATLLRTFANGAHVRTIAAPGIVEAVERGETDSPALDDYLITLLASCREDPPEAVVLGCTHFPFVKGPIARALGGPVVFYDGAEGVARETRRRLAARDLLNAQTAPGRVWLTNSRTDMLDTAWKLFHMVDG